MLLHEPFGSGTCVHMYVCVHTLYWAVQLISYLKTLT